MELKELTEKMLILFEIEQIEDLREAILKCVTSNNFEKYKQFVEIVKDLTVDWLQMIFQYNYADRKEKSQDYTPKTLSKLVSELSKQDNESTVLDMCAGSGALTIQKWNTNKNLKFICKEFDENVIPFLLFNLAVRNIDSCVMQHDVLREETKNAYKITPSETFGIVEKIKLPENIKTKSDTCISNPPYNVKWDIPIFAQVQERFQKCELPPKSNANYAFVLTAINDSEKAVLILPNSVLSSNLLQEIEIRKYLVENNFIESVISCPDNMFEETKIATCIFVLNKNKTTAQVEFIDARQTFCADVRTQNGQFGGASHTNRTYEKLIKTFSDEQIEKICRHIKEQKCAAEFSKSVSIMNIKENGYTLAPSVYIEFVEKIKEHRSYNDILYDLNRTIEQKNICKLTINESLAKSLGLNLENYKKDNEYDEKLNKLLIKLTCEKIKKHDYITFSKNAGEIKFENKSKTELSSVLVMIFNLWKQHIYFLNCEESRYLAELRDALLPELMSGMIEF